MIKESEKIFFIAFNNLIDIDFKEYSFLIKNFSSLEKAYHASYKRLIESGLKSKKVSAFISKRSSFNFSNLLERLERENIKTITVEEKGYPFLLSKTYNPPPLLYYRGSLDIDWFKSLSVVGSRQITSYGLRLVKDIIPNLIKFDLGIISGLALGIDSEAHQVSLNNNGKTIAVLGSGLDLVYPKRNKVLFESIIDKGGLIFSEFPLETKPLAINFPRRNRIIAGLSPATLVLEAGSRSGSSITARYALEEGRDVLAVPGSVYRENCQGTNNLIKNGAIVVLESDDILNLYSLEDDKKN